MDRWLKLVGPIICPTEDVLIEDQVLISGDPGSNELQEVGLAAPRRQIGFQELQGLPYASRPEVHNYRIKWLEIYPARGWHQGAVAHDHRLVSRHGPIHAGMGIALT